MSKRMSLRQAERQQTLRERKQRGDQRRRGEAPPEKKRGGIEVPNLQGKAFVAELSKMNAITPYSLALKYDIRLSTAKEMLHQLERRGLVQLVASNNNIKFIKNQTNNTRR